jgi:uncharacterized protein
MRRALLAIFAGAALARSAAALEVPFLSGRVNDEARLFDAQSASSLEKTLKDYEAGTGRQFVVLTIPSLEGEPLEEFSLKAARTWKLGTKKNDGVLLLVARDDRKVRLEVGYGLEGSLPDALSGRIIRDEMVPRFRRGDYAGGVTAGVDAAIKAMERASSPPMQARRARPRGRPDARAGERLDDDSGLLDKLTIVLFILAMMGFFELVSFTAPELGWCFYPFALLAPFAGFPTEMWYAKLAASLLAAHLIVFPIAQLILTRTDWGRRFAKKLPQSRGNGQSYSSGSGWSSSGGSSSSGGGDSSSSSGDGGGGFSGGGGDFGGGGASGSW